MQRRSETENIMLKKQKKKKKQKANTNYLQLIVITHREK